MHYLQNDFQMPRTIPNYHHARQQHQQQQQQQQQHHLLQQQLQVFQQQFRYQQQQHQFYQQPSSVEFTSPINCPVDTPPSSSTSPRTIADELDLSEVQQSAIQAQQLQLQHRLSLHHSLQQQPISQLQLHQPTQQHDNNRPALVAASTAVNAAAAAANLHHHHHHLLSSSRHRDSSSASSPASNSTTSTSRRSSRAKSKRVRTIFTPEQLKRLEREFSNQMYLVGHDRGFLAESLNLTEAQVKVWFQNRRIKFRKLNPGSSSVDKDEDEDEDENGSDNSLGQQHQHQGGNINTDDFRVDTNNFNTNSNDNFDNPQRQSS